MPTSHQSVFYQAVLNTAVDPIIIIDQTGIIADANAACCTLFGYGSDELIGQNIQILMPEKIAEQHPRFLQRYLESGVPLIIGIGRVVTARNRAGKPITCHISISRVDTEKGIYFTGILRSLEQLRQAQSQVQQLSLVARHTDNAVIITNANGTIEWFNQIFSRLSGYDAAELNGHNALYCLQGPDTDIKELARIEQCMKSRKGTTGTLINYSKQGQPYWVEMTIEPVFSDAEAECQFIIVQRDITSRVKNELKLRRQIDFLRRLNDWNRNSVSPEHLQNAVKILQCFAGFEQTTMTLKRATPFPNRIIQGDNSEPSGNYEDPLAAIVIETARLHEATVSRTSAHHPATTSQHRYICLPMMAGNNCIGALGGVMPALPARCLSRDDQELLQLAVNTIAWAITNCRDKTNLETHLERLRRSQHYANIGTWDWNIQTGELFWTESIPPLFGYPAGELDTSYENFLAAVHPEDRERVNHAVNTCVEKGTKYDIDHRVVWPDGTVRWVNEKGDVQRDSEGRPLKMLGVVQDIHRIKEFEAELLTARVAAEKANQAKSEFLSSMSHELRTPLNSILGFSQLLQVDDLNEDQKESVDLIYRAGNHLLQLVNDVLDLAKLDSGSLKTRIEDVQLKPLLAQCLTLLSSSIEAKDLRVKDMTVGHDINLKADALRLKQAMLNLLSNAIKYNRHGGGIIISCETTAQDRVRISIEDTGYGIPQDRVHEIFKPFSRLGFSNSAIEGAGIGLLITRRLIDAMGGKLDFNSEEGVGSRFWIDIERSSGNRSEMPTVSGVRERRNPGPPASDRRLTILCIEDNEPNRDVLKKMVELYFNADFIAAATMRDGIRKAQDVRPDLVLLDIHLPDGDGLQACREIRQQFGATLPIIAITADAINKIPIGPALFSEVELKPIDVSALRNKIRDLTGG